MKALKNTLPNYAQRKQSRLIDNITKFYDEATEDYGFWSKDFNMHYGYMHHPGQFFKRESMLDQMNCEVFKRLQLPDNSHVLDLGCGTGATSRSLVKHHPTARVTGVNIVASHIEMGQNINRRIAHHDRMSLIHADYHNVPLPNAVADGAYAMESACHSHNKASFLHEAHRLLKPGAKLVISDCFLRNPAKPMNRLSKWAYNRFRKCWSVPHLAEINLFSTMLKDAGFVNIQIEDIRWKVAPSVFHSPFVVARFVLNRLFSGKKTGAQSAKNLKAVLLSIILGLDLRSFSYYLVTATKASPTSH